MLAISWDQLRAAIAVYLDHAYPDGCVPEFAVKRLAFHESQPVFNVIANPPFETYITESPARGTVYALRLGSKNYPHLKLEIRPFANAVGFVFWVNTHDQFFKPGERLPDADAWQRLTESNRELKQSIERRWSECGLPTYATAMRAELG